jgi:hypothetical protein
MEDHETRRKIIRQWMSLPKDKRQTAEQAAAFAKKALEENALQPSLTVSQFLMCTLCCKSRDTARAA